MCSGGVTPHQDYPGVAFEHCNLHHCCDRVCVTHKREVPQSGKLVTAMTVFEVVTGSDVFHVWCVSECFSPGTRKNAVFGCPHVQSALIEKINRGAIPCRRLNSHIVGGRERIQMDPIAPKRVKLLCQLHQRSLLETFTIANDYAIHKKKERGQADTPALLHSPGLGYWTGIPAASDHCATSSTSTPRLMRL